MSKDKKYCPVCGAELDIDAKICTTCGEHILGDVRIEEAVETQNTFDAGIEKLKYCPFCGKEININAVKCKYCKNFIKEDDESESVDGKTILATIFNTLLAFAVFFKIGMFLFSDIGFKDNTTNNNINTAYTQVKPNGVYGSYSGFEGNTWNDDTDIGDIAFDCTAKGAGISLTEQIEGFFIYEVDELKEKFPYFYEIKHANPRIEFSVSNPKWEEKFFDIFANSQFCRADVNFLNIPKDTVMGYYRGQPYTLINAYCSIVYKVSRQGKKYKANVSNFYCEPSYGYR